MSRRFHPEQYGLRGVPRPEAERQACRWEHEDREAEHRAAVENNRRTAMKTYTTAQGDRVPRFPKTDAIRQAAGDAYAAIEAAYEEAEKSRALRDRLNTANPADVKRFPVLGGGA